MVVMDKCSETFQRIICSLLNLILYFQVTELREKGNECVRAGNYAEAILHYSHAIKQDSSSPQLYSNRSFAFLKLQQYYYALEDANEAIRLDPTWAKVS